MEKKSDNRVCMDNKAGFENSNLLNPVGSQASDHQSTSESAGSQPEWSSAWSNRPGRTRTLRSISRPYLIPNQRKISFIFSWLCFIDLGYPRLDFSRLGEIGSFGASPQPEAGSLRLRLGDTAGRGNRAGP